MTVADHTTVKVPHFKTNEKTGRYIARHALTKEQIIKAASRLLFTADPKGKSFTDVGLTKLYLKDKYANRSQEVFVCLYLDNQHCLLADEVMFKGTIDQASVYPREVVRRAIELNAAAIIYAHNHPSGITEPSQADINITRTLVDALKLIGVRSLDHIVIGDGVYSMAQSGLM
jgi:DNA repair protein RadC